MQAQNQPMTVNVFDVSGPENSDALLNKYINMICQKKAFKPINSNSG